MEDVFLEVFDIMDFDWIFVGFDDEYGFVFFNYIEMSEEVDDIVFVVLVFLVWFVLIFSEFSGVFEVVSVVVLFVVVVFVSVFVGCVVVMLEFFVLLFVMLLCSWLIYDEWVFDDELVCLLILFIWFWLVVEFFYLWYEVFIEEE